MAFAFPSYFVIKGEDAKDFCDNFELVYLATRHDTKAMQLRAFPLVMKNEAKMWFNGLSDDDKATWVVLKVAFLRHYQRGNTPEE